MECDSFVNWAFTLVAFTKHWTRCYNFMREREGEGESERVSLLCVQTWNQFMCKGHRNHNKITIMCSTQLGWNEQLLMLYSACRLLVFTCQHACTLHGVTLLHMVFGGRVGASTCSNHFTMNQGSTQGMDLVHNNVVVVYYTQDRFLTVVQHTNNPSFSVIKWIVWLVTQKFLTKWKHQQPSLWRDGR